MVLTPEIMQTAFTERQSGDKEQENQPANVDMMDESENISGELEEGDDLSSESMFNDNTVVTRIESRPFKGIPKEWHETIQVKHKVT